LLAKEDVVKQDIKFVSPTFTVPKRSKPKKRQEKRKIKKVQNLITAMIHQMKNQKMQMNSQKKKGALPQNLWKFLLSLQPGVVFVARTIHLKFLKVEL